MNSKSEIRSVALAFLRDNPLATIATINSKNRPESSAVLYVVDEDFCFYFFTKSASRKFSNLERAPHSSITVASLDEMLTIQADGITRQFNDPKHIASLLTHLATILTDTAQSHWPPPVKKIEDGTMRLMKFTPYRIRFGDFRDKKTPGASYYFDIDPPADTLVAALA